MSDALRVLLPQDGSELSAWALERAETLLRRPGVSATLLRVIEAPAGLAGDLAYRVDPRHAEAAAALRAQRDRLDAMGVPARAELRFGEPADAILREIRWGGHDLAVLSTHGRGGWARYFLGSVARSVLAGSTIPLLMFRPLQDSDGGLSPAAAREPAMFRRILVPLDGSPQAEEILKPAVELARRLDAQMHLVTAVPPGPEAPRRRRAAEEELERGRAGLAAGGLKTWVEVRTGDPSRVVEEVALEWGADLVAMTTHGRTGLARTLLGGVADRLLRILPVPVLVSRCRALAEVVEPTPEKGPVVHLN